VWFRGEQIGDFRADLIVAHAVLVELKAARALEPAHEAQLLNYWRASNLEIGCSTSAQPRRSNAWFWQMKKRKICVHLRNLRLKW